jgi:hypothetical protein
MSPPCTQQTLVPLLKCLPVDLWKDTAVGLNLKRLVSAQVLSALARHHLKCKIIVNFISQKIFVCTCLPVAECDILSPSAAERIFLKLMMCFILQ